MSETAIDPRLSFSNSIPQLQTAWDSTSLGTLKECPRKYQYSIIEGWRLKRGSSLHLRFGILYHRALEVYDHKRFEGLDHNEALRLSLRDLAAGCMDTTDDGTRKWWNPSEGLDEKKAAENTKTIYTLFRSVVWYLEQFKDDPAKTVKLANGKPAVELSFRFESGHVNGEGESLLFSGHLDRVVDFNNQPWVLDRKTTKATLTSYYFDGYHPDNQMSLYTLASRIAFAVPAQGVIIDAVQIAKGFSRFERGFTMRTDAQLEEWFADALHYIELAEGYARKGHWPMNDKSCDKFGGCPFRRICSKSPEVRDIFLQSDFQREPWDPLKVRGEI